MRKCLTLLCVLIGSLGTSAQTNTVSMGPGYANEVFWSLSEGNAGEAAINTWDLAFRMGIQTSSIFINSANGVSLYHVPNTDTGGWLALDTTGLSSWHQLFNTDTSWEFGAFDVSSTGFPDVSWGDYDFTTHVVTGDSLYVLELAGPTSTVYKKLWIIKKDFGNWTFRFANLDNTGDKTITLLDADYPDRNFAYYSVTNESALNPEPNNTGWDILFTRYVTLLPPDNTPYLVTGVLNNVGVEAAEAKSVDLSAVNVNDYAGSYSTNISEIGYDWKFFDGTQYLVLDSLCYFVKAVNGDIYQVVFTTFEGSSTGNITFEETYLLSSVSPMQNELETGAVYPNPVNESLNLVFSAKKTLNKVDLDLYDVNGCNVFHSFTNAQSGLNQKSVSLPELTSGIYLLRLNSGNDEINIRVMVAR